MRDDKQAPKREHETDKLLQDWTVVVCMAVAVVCVGLALYLHFADLGS